MRCLECGSEAVTERPECTAQGYRRFRCRACAKRFNERSGGALNRTQYPSDVTALVVLWRLRYRLSLRDLPEMFAVRGIGFSYEAVREWEAKLTPALAKALRRRRRGKVGSGRGCVARRWYGSGTPTLTPRQDRERAQQAFGLPPGPTKGHAQQVPGLDRHVRIVAGPPSLARAGRVPG